MFRITYLFLLTLIYSTMGNYTFADIGGDRMVPNTPGRCWRVVHRDFAVKGNLVTGYMFKMLSVGGTGQTDDIITYEFTVKEDYSIDDGWDESKTRQYTGSGLIKEISNGRVRFEIYVDIGNGTQTTTVQGYYHPGNGTSDSDDRIILELPQNLQSNQNPDDCSESMQESTDDF